MGIRDEKIVELKGVGDGLRCRVLYPSVRNHRERKMLW